MSNEFIKKFGKNSEKIRKFGIGASGNWFWSQCYVPSFLLLGICFATTYFKTFYFEASVTVNLTVMLVATTLFIRYYFKDLFDIHNVQKRLITFSWTWYKILFHSVMEKLPPTSYVRMVDMWLIATQILPFLLGKHWKQE